MSINYQFYKELFCKQVLLHNMMSFEEENMKYLTNLQFGPLCCLGLQHNGQRSIQITGCLEKHCLIGRVLTKLETQVRFWHD